MDACVRITVLKRLRFEDLLEQYATSVWARCERLSDGEAFISEHGNMPEGFCSWAWTDIQKYVLTLARGGDFVGTIPGTHIVCCTDGFRPVLFKIERVRDA
jgi:uncharacterized repeat protein (TIGR04076 family)